MNTDKANEYLDSMQINDRSVFDKEDVEHPLYCLLEDYHQEQLKNLGVIGDVSKCFTIEEVKKMFFDAIQIGNGYIEDTHYPDVNVDIAEREWLDYIKENNISNCDHSNEVQRQGDGFVYAVCGDCGEDLD